MTTVATKEVMAYRMQAGELGHGPQAHTPLYLDATAVLYGTATEQVSREMKHLAAKPARPKWSASFLPPAAGRRRRPPGRAPQRDMGSWRSVPTLGEAARWSDSLAAMSGSTRFGALMVLQCGSGEGL